MTDKYLQQLWSKAVRKLHGERCYVCGGAAHSVHHIIRRRHKLTRYDVRNGVPLCAECHKTAQRSIGWDIDKIPLGDKLYLQTAANINIKDFLVHNGMTEKEWMNGEGEKLKEILNDNKLD